MGVELLIHTFDHSKGLAGFVQAVRGDSDLAVSPWGLKETLPNYAVIRLTDGTIPNVQRYLESWRNTIIGTPVSMGGGFRRFILRVPNNTTRDFGSDKGISIEVVDFLVNQRGSKQVSINPNRSSAVFDLPQATFSDILEDLVDRFEEELSPRRFQIALRDVNDAITGGGFFATIFAPVNARLIDRQV